MHAIEGPDRAARWIKNAFVVSLWFFVIFVFQKQALNSAVRSKR